MKHLGKRTLSMMLTFVLTVSIFLSDISLMQVNATSSVNNVLEGENGIVEVVAEENLPEDSSESSSADNTEPTTVESETEPENIPESETEETKSGTEDATQTEEAEAEESVTETESVEESTEETVEETTEVMTTEMEETVEETTEVMTTEMEETETSTELLENPDLAKMEEVTAPAGMTEVYAGNGYHFYVDADGVLAVLFDDSNEKKLSGEIAIPSEVKVIPKDEALFYGNTQVTKVTFDKDSQLERMEDQAFFSSSITEIRIPKSVTYIGKQAFHASGLTKVIMEAGGEAIVVDDMAFQKNEDLTMFVTNRRLKSIGKYAFEDNSSLTNFLGALGNTKDEYALYGVEEIGERAFKGCTSLTHITIPSTLTVLEEGVFENCSAFGKDKGYFSGIRAVKLGSGITKIATSAFSGCSSLTQLEIPASVASIGNDVFAGCSKLNKIIIRNQSGDNQSCNVTLTDTSFPYVKNLTLSAYDGTVEEWIGFHEGYGLKYESLYKKYNISYSKEIKNGKVKANVTKAQVGELITLTVTPNDGYTLEHDQLWYTYEEDRCAGVIDPWTYTFEMPECDIIICAEFVKTSELAYGNQLELTEEGVFNKLNDDTISYDSEKNTLHIRKTGQTAKIQIVGSNGKTPGIGELKFTSKNTKVVTVDSYGNIRSIAPGETKISVSLKSKSKSTKALEMTVVVEEKTTVKELSLSYKAPSGKVEYASEADSEANRLGYDIITYPASTLKLNSKNLTVNFDGRDEEGDKLDVTYQIAAEDTGVAKPVKAKVSGKGVITIPKKTWGETIVTVTAADGAKEPASCKFIVRVVDDTPRLVTTTVNVDPQSETGTLVELVSVYGKTSDMSNFAIYTKEVSKNGITTWKSADDMFELNVVGDEIYLKAKAKDQYKDGKTRTYKNKYYISGLLEGSDTRFYIAIPVINITKKKLTLPLKSSGKINLFYNGSADIQKVGKVEYVPKDKKPALKIVKCELLNKTKVNGSNTADDGAFTENFSVSFDYETQKITIVRNPLSTDLSCYSAGKSKGKPVVSGILKLYYEGYDESYASETAISVATHTTKPSYQIKLTTAANPDKTLKKISLNKNASGQQYQVSFINKSTKLAEDFTDATTIRLNYESGKTPYGLVANEEENGYLTPDLEKDFVPIEIGIAQKGKIVMIVSQPDWEEGTSLQFSVETAVTSTKPAVKLGKTTLTVNAACTAAIDYTTMILSQEDSELSAQQEFTLLTKGGENIRVQYDSTSKTVRAQITGEVKTGTYKFRCIPQYTYAGSGMPDVAKTIYLYVKVNNVSPSIKLKSTSFKVNANCYKNGDGKYDSMIRTYSWVSLPAEYSDYTLNQEDMVFTYRGKKGSKDPFADSDGKTKVRLLLDTDKKQAKVWIESTYKVQGSATYRVSGLKLENGSQVVDVKPFDITVGTLNAMPSVSVSAKGTINPLDPSSQILYTPKLGNISGSITSVMIRELDKEGGLVAAGSEHFYVYQDAQTGKTVLKVKEGAQLENRTYKMKLYYTLSNGESGSRGDGWYSVKDDIKVTPKQTMPTLVIDKKSTTFYAGNKDKTQTFTITKKSQVNANITDIKFSSKVPKKLQEAFAIDYNAETGKMELRLVNSALVKQNKNQTLTFEIICDGQLQGTTGRTFTATVKVVK